MCSILLQNAGEVNSFLIKGLTADRARLTFAGVVATFDNPVATAVVVGVPTIAGDIEVFVEAVGVAAGELDGEFGIGEVNIVKLDAGLDASKHIVSAASGIDGDLGVFKLEDAASGI